MRRAPEQLLFPWMLTDSAPAQHLLKFGLVILFTLEAQHTSALIKLLFVFAEEDFIWIVAAQAVVMRCIVPGRTMGAELESESQSHLSVFC